MNDVSEAVGFHMIERGGGPVKINDMDHPVLRALESQRR